MRPAASGKRALSKRQLRNEPRSATRDKCAFPAIVPNVSEGFWPRVISEKRSWHHGNDVPVFSAFLPI